MGKQYFVEWIGYNPENAEGNRWYFKNTERFDSLDSAKKHYHSILSQKIGYGTFTHICACLYDECFKIIAREEWDKTIVPVVDETVEEA